MSTPKRFDREQSRTQLAIRMIGHEARTYLIRTCTGLSEDRIRKLYHTYYRQEGFKISRHRGKTPRQTEYFTRNPTAQLESTTLVRICLAAGLIRLQRGNRIILELAPTNAEYGLRFCDAYEAYLTIHSPPDLSFERAWHLLDALSRGNVIGLATCRRCRVSFLEDRLGLQEPLCPACRLARPH